MSVIVAPPSSPSAPPASCLAACLQIVSAGPFPPSAAKNARGFALSHFSASGRLAFAHNRYMPLISPIGRWPPLGFGMSGIATAAT